MRKSRHTPILVESFAFNLRTLRLARGITQEQLADECGLSIAYISLLERGGRVAPLNTVERIANAIGVAPHLLLVPPRSKNGAGAGS